MRTTRAILAVSLFVYSSALLAQNLGMGARYHIIDREVEEVVTRFADAEVITTRDGARIVTEVRSLDGKRMREPFASSPEQVRLVPTKITATAQPLLVDALSLDAVNAQAYLAMVRRRDLSVRGNLDTLERANSNARANMTAAAEEVVSVRSRTATLEAYSQRGNPDSPREQELPAFTSVLRERKTGDVLGVMAWFPKHQALVYQTRWHQDPIVINPAAMKMEWSFTPNPAWANIQLLSFAKGAPAGYVQRQPSGGGKRLGTDNEPGCDGFGGLLHRLLDGTIFQPCCDQHDACYYAETPNCTAGSWWFQGTWACTACNIQVILCMTMLDWEELLTAALISFKYPLYRWQPPDPNCYFSWMGDCPSWCYGCVWP
ncbi:MAG TPA: hypothetical protein VF432_09465 [Thermoanaerobaculia bacterium]